MAIFDDLPGIVSDLLADLDADEGIGQSVTFTHVTGRTYSTTTRTYSGGGTTTETAVAVVADVRGKDLIEGEIIAGDKKLTIAGPDLTTEPLPGSSTASVDGVSLTVLRVVKTQPGDEVALWSIFCGKR